MLSVGERFPDFRLTACVNRKPQTAFQPVAHDSYPGKWVLYFFWPKDFTPICGTELREFAALMEEFSSRDTVVVGGSIDSEFAHLAWSRFGQGPDELPFPLLADLRRELSLALGILDQREGVCQRATFIVDPSQTIRHSSVNDFSVGRNPIEVLRILDALQTDALCPARWEKGQPVIESTTTLIDQIPMGAMS
jgi:alkyl hydroperoxide reductase subunit AhpC